jgi:ABC-type multidrug transport system fused ATPase/permease subunit
VMIFDEATSNLDSHNEKLIQNAIEKCRKESTLIIIAHRLSTITSADQIIVIRDGEVAEVGTHDMLIGQEAEYAHLWDLQSKKSDQAVLV